MRHVPCELLQGHATVHDGVASVTRHAELARRKLDFYLPTRIFLFPSLRPELAS